MAGHDALLLQRFLLARRRRDEAAARTAWDELVELNFDRVVTLVRVESRGRLSAGERDDAVQRALTTMLTRFMDTFRGTSMGEWVSATRTLVHYACVDTQRRAAAFSGRMEELTDDAEGEIAEERDPLLQARRGVPGLGGPPAVGPPREVIELDRAEVSRRRSRSAWASRATSSTRRAAAR